MQDESINSGIGFVGLLTIVFITLKLCSVIKWSWWWVLSPLWIPTTFVICLVMFICIAAFLVTSIKYWWR